MLTAAGIEAVAARPGLVRLEGLHAVKHALRFGAIVELAVSPRPEAVLGLADELAPDLTGALAELLTPVEPADFARVGGGRLPSPVLAWARRPDVDPGAALRAGPDPVVLLDQPRHAGNAGAVVRVAAAAGARAVLMTGPLDPWSPAVLRAAAGLHFAVDVAHLDALPAGPRPLVALDPGGDLLEPGLLAGGPVLAFGGERHGLGADLLARAEAVVRLPMRAGVSSLNLATTVAAVLYQWRLSRPALNPDAPAAC